jgi:hypothetical protein
LTNEREHSSSSFLFVDWIHDYFWLSLSNLIRTMWFLLQSFTIFQLKLIDFKLLWYFLALALSLTLTLIKHINPLFLLQCYFVSNFLVETLLIWMIHDRN